MLETIKKNLIEYNKKVWIMYNSDSSDSFFCKYICNTLNTATLCIITCNKVYFIVMLMFSYIVNQRN